jgi:hypothetical protein
MDTWEHPTCSETALSTHHQPTGSHSPYRHYKLCLLTNRRAGSPVVAMDKSWLVQAASIRAFLDGNWIGWQSHIVWLWSKLFGSVKEVVYWPERQGETRDWLDSKVLTLTAWEGSRLKMMGLDALPTHKRVVAWFPGPVEDTWLYFQRLCRLNQGLDANHWRIYELKKGPNGVHLWLSTDTTSVIVLERMGWRPFSGMGQAIFSLLGVQPEGRK